jgi:hypothetical protein
MNKLSPQTIEELEMLFDLAQPAELRTTLTELFFDYVQGIETEMLPLNFKEHSENIRFLIRFLQVAQTPENEAV